MKTIQKITRSIFYLLTVSILLSNCSDDKDDPSPGKATELGTFVGTISVNDDPQTKLGYITNAKVTVTASGSVATIKISGDSGFERMYTGKVTQQSTGSADISVEKQTKPTEKIAGDRVLIFNNKLTLIIDVTNDEVTAKSNPSASTTIVITGKLQLIGTDMLRQ